MDYQLVYGDELKHYGVIGMKWGVRRGNYAQSYAKGVKKLKKLDAKANKLKIKSDKISAKAAKVYAKGRDDEHARELEAKARQLKYKSTKKVNKGKKFYKKMEKVFAEVDVKELNKEDVEYGKRYAMQVLS